MDRHRGMMSYTCPNCQARISWRLRETRDGTDTQGDTGDNQGQLRVGVVVERWLPRHRKLVSITLTLLVQPEKAIQILNASLYPPPPAHEPTLAEVVAQTPAMVGEAAGEVVADLIGLIVPGSACGLCAELTEALVGALVGILLAPIVAPIVLFLDCVSVIGALLPGGDINLVGMGLIKRWTGDVLEDALSPHLQRWEQIFALSDHAGLTQLTVRPVERQASHPPRPRVAPPDAVELPGAVDNQQVGVPRRPTRGRPADAGADAKSGFHPAWTSSSAPGSPGTGSRSMHDPASTSGGSASLPGTGSLSMDGPVTAMDATPVPASDVDRWKARDRLAGRADRHGPSRGGAGRAR